MAVELSVIVPTYQEKGNVLLLLEKLRLALSGLDWEVIYVDDNSPDGTAELILEEGLKNPRVRCLKRIGHFGLSSACMAGMLFSKAPFLAVMDADLQHDEGLLPHMLRVIKEESLDVVIGSRYVDGGGLEGWAPDRMAVSKNAARFVQMVTGLPIKDPLSGFFLVRKEFFDQSIVELQGNGFKILLDLILSSYVSPKLKELPYISRARQHGASKLTMKVILEFFVLVFHKCFRRFCCLKKGGMNARLFLIGALAMTILPFNAMAETVVLKSGKVVEVKILEKTAHEVRVDFFGVPLTFSLDEVDTIDGERVFAPVAGVAVSGKEDLTVEAQAYGVSDRQEVFDHAFSRFLSVVVKSEAPDSELRPVMDLLIQFSRDFPQSRFSKDAAFMVQYVLFRKKIGEGRKEEALSIMDEIGKIVSRYPDGGLERFTCQKVRQADPMEAVDIPFKYAVPYLRGYLEVKWKDFDAALKSMGFIEKDYKVSEYGKGLFIQQVHGLLIESFMGAGELEQARMAARRAVDQFPDSPWTEGWQKLLQQE